MVFSLILGTATPGGGFPPFGAAYAAPRTELIHTRALNCLLEAGLGR